MRNKFLIAAALFLCGAANAQWPVSAGLQGTITGTIGEVRGNGGRIHNGTDVIGTSTTVYSIQEDQISRINAVNSNGQSLGTSKNIVMTSGITYFHVTVSASIAANALQIQQINNGTRVVTLTQGQAFAEMVIQANWPTHVHVVNGTNENFLTNGFGAPSFTFVDNVVPQYGLPNNADSVAFFKELIGQAWQAPTRFNTRVTDEGLALNAQPLILWGPVDIVANVYQQRISATGTATGGHLAPKFLGYRVTNTTTNAVVFDNFETVQFDFGFGGGTVDAASQEVFRRIHSRNSGVSNPYFIISNLFSNSTSTEGNLPTDQYSDGDYTVTVRTKGAKGTATDASELIADKVCKVRLDNYKTYVKKVEVSDANSLVKYFAEWSSLTRPGDGSIILEKRNSEPFKSGTEVRIGVTTSEKVPSLTLTLSGGPNVTMTAVGTEGKEWTGNFTMPSSASKKVQMSFKSGDKLYGLILNQEAADVKRDPDNGRFSDQQSTDRNHELKVCPVDYPLTLDVNVQNGQDVMLVADGGTAPYEYSMDLMPIAANHKSTFGSINSFTIEFDKNYLFKVRDAGGCQAEKYYTLPKVQCDALTLAGGEGTDIKQVNLGNIAGTVNVYYEMYSVPDQITVTYRGVSQTTGIVSGSGVLSFQHTPQQGLSNLVTITMYAPYAGTAWTYQVVCPTGLTSMRSPDVQTTAALLSYSADKVIIVPLNGGENEIYRLRYRVIGEEKWTELSGLSLPYSLDRKGRELEVKVTKDVAVTVKKLSVNPNPARGAVQIQYQSEKEGTAVVGVYGQKGQQVMRRSISVKKGMNLISWQPDKGISGLMLVQVVQDGRAVATKVIVEK
jgi:hypothetical protein